MKIQLWRARGIPGFLLCQVDEETGCYLSDDSHTVLIQTDWDYPSIAAVFGWNMRESQVMNRQYYGAAPCEHNGTDGTIPCEACGLTPRVFISNAQEWLDNNLGTIAEDPGYFQ